MQKKKITNDASDARGLIREAFRMDGLTDENCRSIFFDWALGLPDEVEVSKQADKLYGKYSEEYPDHPMTRLLAEAKESSVSHGRKRGRFSKRARK
ncbi:MAG: hypothetical protein OXC26_24445 [Albidovulum sp.]|nr:hypothetical protein [Albidovulum sp.]